MFFYKNYVLGLKRLFCERTEREKKILMSKVLDNLIVVVSRQINFSAKVGKPRVMLQWKRANGCNGRHLVNGRDVSSFANYSESLRQRAFIQVWSRWGQVSGSTVTVDTSVIQSVSQLYTGLWLLLSNSKWGMMPADVGLKSHVYPLDLSYYPSVNRRECLECLVWTFRMTAWSNNALFAIDTKRKTSTTSVFNTFFELLVLWVFMSRKLQY